MTVSVADAPAVDISVIGVVVPARNEELRLPRCLQALQVSVHRLGTVDPAGPRVRVIVVCDDSTDGTQRIAGDWPGVEVVTSAVGRVGAARGAGIRHLLGTESLAGTSPENLWIACTDADSAVPHEWLHTQVQHARSGVELLLGTVRPDPQELSAGVLAAYRLRRWTADGHPHIHGANLGIRSDTYLAAGGFADVACHEDVRLSAAVRTIGAVVVSTGASPVLTSARRHGRAPDGMAHYLRELDERPHSRQARPDMRSAEGIP